MTPILKQINNYSSTFSNISDEELKNKALELKEKIVTERITNKTLRKNLPLAFALVKEAIMRAVSMELFNTQIQGAVELFNGNIVEMAPGEGKTFTIMIAAYLKSLSGNHIHIMTEDDFLLQRDFNQATKIFSYLGVSVGAVPSKAVPEYDELNKKHMYSYDIVYIHPIEASFDYLRANDKSTFTKAELIIDDIDRVIATKEPKSIVLSSEDGKDFDNILLSDFIKEYRSFCGIADFAVKEAKFYKKFFNKNIVSIPLNKKSQRIHIPDELALTKEEKYDKILQEALEVHKYRCPIVIVVPNENEAEMMTSRLEKKGFNFKVADDKNKTRGIYNISQAGRLNSVTVVTKQTGVDVPLGGDAFYLALSEMDSMGISPNTEAWTQEWSRAYEFTKRVCEQEKNVTQELGGIFTIIAEHSDHDDAFEYYSARRGEVGSVKYYSSLEDRFLKDINLDKFFSLNNWVNKF